MPSCTAIPDRVPEDETLRRTGRRRWPMRLATSTTGRKSRQPATRIGSGPFQAAKALLLRESHPRGTSSLRSGRFARLVHFGAIKMDIGPGIHLNAWRERTCRMKEGGQTPRSGNGKKLPQEQLHTIGPVKKETSRPGRRTGRTRAQSGTDSSSMPETTPPRSERRQGGPTVSGRRRQVRREGAP